MSSGTRVVNCLKECVEIAEKVVNCGQEGLDDRELFLLVFIPFLVLLRGSRAHVRHRPLLLQIVFDTTWVQYTSEWPREPILDPRGKTTVVPGQSRDAQIWEEPEGPGRFLVCEAMLTANGQWRVCAKNVASSLRG